MKRRIMNWEETEDTGEKEEEKKKKRDFFSIFGREKKKGEGGEENCRGLEFQRMWKRKGRLKGGTEGGEGERII